MIVSSIAPSNPGRLSLIASRARREPDLAFGLALAVLVILVVLFPGLFTTQSPLTINVAKAMQAPSALHLFGTDDVGRDVLARVVHGARITLSICASALIAAALIGGGFGVISGFVGGRIDMLLGGLCAGFLSFPPAFFRVLRPCSLGRRTGARSFSKARTISCWRPGCRRFRDWPF